MREFWPDIMERWLSWESWDHEKVSMLESMIYEECALPEERMRIKEHDLQLLMEEIQKREADAKRYGDGEEDVLLSVFGACLRKRNRRSRIRRKRDEIRLEEVYDLLRQGLSWEMICRKMNISLEQAFDAVSDIFSCYDDAEIQTGERSVDRKQGVINMQTAVTLWYGTWRVLRQDTTGAVRYRFYYRDRLVGTATAMVCPGFPVVLQQGGMILNSSFDPEQTIFPGVSREIVDADNCSESVARLTWQGSGEHTLTVNWGAEPQTVRILTKDEEHQFWVEDRQIALIRKLPQRQSISDWEVGWCLRPMEELPDEMAMLLMSFPMLRFAM